jgi:hypothetical protein
VHTLNTIEIVNHRVSKLDERRHDPPPSRHHLTTMTIDPLAKRAS